MADPTQVASDSSLETSEDTPKSGVLVGASSDRLFYAYTIITPPSKGTITLGSMTGVYTYTPAKDFNGTDSFTFRYGASNAATVKIAIAAVNDAPTVGLPLSDQIAQLGSAFTYTFPSNTFRDVDNAVLSYDATRDGGIALPGWLSFNPTTRTFSGTPGDKDIGNFDLQVSASDGSLSVSDIFKITVTDGPVAKSYVPTDGARSVPVGSNLLITFDKPIKRGSGPITLKSADGKLIETFSSSGVTVAGSLLTLNPSVDLKIFTKYTVELGADAVRDMSGKSNPADNRLSFQTSALDALYQFFIVAFNAAPGAFYMGQLADAVNSGMEIQQVVEIFTGKVQFPYSIAMPNADFAGALVRNVVKDSASIFAQQAAADQMLAALNIGWTRGKTIYTVFGNLASKSVNDPVWGNTAKQFQNQMAVARYLTEEMGYATEDAGILKGLITKVTPETDVSTPEKIVQIIGTLPPGG